MCMGFDCGFVGWFVGFRRGGFYDVVFRHDYDLCFLTTLAALEYIQW